MNDWFKNIMVIIIIILIIFILLYNKNNTSTKIDTNNNDSLLFIINNKLELLELYDTKIDSLITLSNKDNEKNIDNYWDSVYHNTPVNESDSLLKEYLKKFNR